METFIKELISTKERDLKIVVNYIINTLKAKELYNNGGWQEVGKNYNDSEFFNHNFSITSTAICMKLRENKKSINLPIQANMKIIEIAVNSLLGINAVEYYIDRKNHALRIVI